MLDSASWLLSLELAAPLLLDGVSIHPLLGDAFVHRAMDAHSIADPVELAMLDLSRIDRGRYRATIANLGSSPSLLLQGEVLRRGTDEFEVVTPRLVPPDAALTVELKRVAAGSGDPAAAETWLRPLMSFVVPRDTVGYLAMIGSELARLELFPGPITCRRRWHWALGSVLARPRRRVAQEAVPGHLIRSLAAACSAGSWTDEAPYVRRLKAHRWPGLVGRFIVLDERPIYLDLAVLGGSVPAVVGEPAPRRIRSAAVALTAPGDATPGQLPELLLQGSVSRRATAARTRPASPR